MLKLKHGAQVDLVLCEREVSHLNDEWLICKLIEGYHILLGCERDMINREVSKAEFYFIVISYVNDALYLKQLYIALSERNIRYPVLH